MKKSFWLLICSLLILTFIFLVIFAFSTFFAEAFTKIWMFSNSNIWLFIFTIVSLPFSLFAAVNLYRGFLTILVSDIKKLRIGDSWLRYAYIIAAIVGCFSLFCLIGLIS